MKQKHQSGDEQAPSLHKPLDAVDEYLANEYLAFIGVIPCRLAAQRATSSDASPHNGEDLDACIIMIPVNPQLICVRFFASSHCVVSLHELQNVPPQVV